MKLKYKGIIILITMGTMCIGMVTLSIHSPKAKSGMTGAVQTEAFASPAASLPSPSSTGIPGAQSAFAWETNPEVTELVKKYYDAELRCDMDALKDLVTDPSYINEDVLKAQQTSVEEYRNMECYIVSGPREGDYLVYVYREVKFFGIDTPAPGLSSLYITTDADGKARILQGVLDDARTEQFIEDSRESDYAAALVNSVNIKLEEAKASDSKLKEFVDSVNSIVTKENEGTPEP